MKICVPDSKHTLAYIIRSCLLAIYDVEIVDEPTTDGYDLLVANKKDVKSKKLDKNKIVLAESPYRCDKIRADVNSFAIANGHFSLLPKKERKQEDFAEALEKSKELARAREAKRMKRVARIKRK